MKSYYRMLRTAFRQPLKRAGSRYIIVGGSVYILELLIIVVAQKLGQNTIVAIGLSFWIGLGISFLLQKFITFGDKRLHHQVLLSQLLAYIVLVLFNFGFTVLVAGLLRHLMPAVVIRTLALGMTTIWNFYLYKTRIFHTKDGPLY